MTEPRLYSESCTSTVVPSRTVCTLRAALQPCLVTEGAHWAAHSSDAAHFTISSWWADVAGGSVCGGGVVGTTCAVVTCRALGHRVRISCN